MNEAQIIRYIEEGIVIDHLPAGVAWKVAEILGLNKQRKGRISLGDNHKSKKTFELKSFVKIEGRQLTPYEMNLISLVAPNATLNIILGGFVQEKRKVQLPAVLKGIIPCPNLNCISNQSKEKISSKIYVKNDVFTCHYCRQTFSRADFDI